MKRVLQKQRSALKFLASARPHHGSESSSINILLTPVESDNVFMTLEEDFNSIMKTAASADTTNLQKRMRKLWSLILVIRRNEAVLRDLYEKREMKPVPLKSSKTAPTLKTYESGTAITDSGKVDDARRLITEERSLDKTSEATFIVSESERAANREMFEMEKRNLHREIISLKEKLMKNMEITEELNKKIGQYEEKIKQLKSALEVQTSETLKELKLRQNFENRVKDSQKQMEVREKELENTMFQLNNAKEQIRLLESTTNEQKLANELLAQNNSHLSQKILKLQGECNSQTSILEDLTQKYTSLLNEVKLYEENATKMLNDINKNSKLKEMYQKRIQFSEAQKKDLIAEKGKLINNLKLAEKEMENCRNMLENEKRAVETLNREKELLMKNFLRVNDSNDEQKRILNIEVRMKNQLEFEVNRLNHDVLRQNDCISALEKERNKLKEKNIELQIDVEEMRKCFSEKESTISDLKKKLNDVETNYKHQNCLLENLRKDKSLCNQDLSQTKEEVADLKQKIKILTRKIEEEKENLISKENELLKEKAILQKLEGDKEKLYGEIALCKEVIKNSKERINESSNVEKNLNCIIQKMETELQKKEKQMLQMACEQELLSTQLLQKNEEIAKFDAKLKLCETIREQLESESRQHSVEISALNLEVKRLNAEKATLRKYLTTIANLRTEVFSLERELTKQRIKCRALEEELQNPLNIHRWRKLEGTDPNTFELITKIQLLQKRVLTKSEIAAEKEQQLKDLETLCENLRTTMTNLSPTEISRKVFFLRKESEEKNKMIKTLTVQMNIYESQAIECKLELEQKNKELEDLKTKYFKQKRLFFKHKNEKPKSACQPNNSNVNEISALGEGFLAKSALPTIKTCY